MANQCMPIATVHFYAGRTSTRKWVVVMTSVCPQSCDFKPAKLGQIRMSALSNIINSVTLEQCSDLLAYYSMGQQIRLKVTLNSGGVLICRKSTDLLSYRVVVV